MVLNDRSCCHNVLENKRYFLAILACLGLIIILAQRCEIGIAIIKMTEYRKISENVSVNNETVRKYLRVRDVAWSNTKVSLIEASFFIGYTIFSIPGGFLVSIGSPNIVLGVAALVSGCLNLFIPLLVHNAQSFVSVFLVRIIQGMCDGCLYPSMHSFWRYWAPRSERSKLVTITFFGIALGPIIGYPVSGFITNKHGWEANFYFWGSLVLFWGIIWLLISRKSPSTDSWITKNEREYIENNTAFGVVVKPSNIPWGSIFTSIPVWAIIVANVGRNWTFQFSFSGLPSYFKHRFHESSINVGLNMSLPFIIMAVLTPIGGIYADCLIKRGHSVKVVRRIFNSVGFGISGVCFLILGFMPYLWLATIFLSIGLGTMGLGMSGFGVNHLDIADIYAGVLMGISNGIGTMAGIISPIVAMSLTRNTSMKDFSYEIGWQIFFVLSGFIQIISVILYAFFSSGEPQTWSTIAPATTKTDYQIFDNQNSSINKDPNDVDYKSVEQ